MRIAGVIAEYNPFHAGHAYHLAQVRQRTGADAVIVVMSSCFVQRGEAAVLPPADRARMALACGADAVFALPACWALRDAEHFALGGVALLAGLGADVISFGTETANLPLMHACAQLLEQPDECFTGELHRLLDTGVPYPAALAAAVQMQMPDAGALLSNPNSTLAVCYLRAMLRLGRYMEVCPIPRCADYHATGLTQALPSATALRGAIHRGDWAGCRSSMPAEAFDILRDAALHGHIFRPGSLDQLLIHRLRTISPEALHALPDLSEGIEDRLCASAALHPTRETLLAAAKTRRYPYARLSRLCTHALLGITADQLAREPLPTAAWLLGLHENARGVFAHIKEKGSLTVIGKAAAYTGDDAWFRTELAAYELWALGCGLPAGMGKTQGVIRV